MLRLSDCDNKNVRLILKSGEFFEGEAVFCSPEYCFHEYGAAEAALQLDVNDESFEPGWLLYEHELAEIQLLVKPSARRLHFACEDSFVTIPWSGGKTTQFLIYPRQADYAERDFLWRISSASVEAAESDFTPLPDYHRFITPLKGSMTLFRPQDAEVLLNPFDILSFDGADPTHSRGSCTDFNLMLRKGRARGNMLRMNLNGEYQPLPLLEDMQDILLLCPEADCRIRTPFSELLLPAGELLIGENAASISLAAQSKTPARLLVAQAGV